MQGWLAAAASVVALVWVGLIGLVAGLPPTTTAATAADRLVPPDGHAQRVALDGGVPAVVESARLRGIAGFVAAPRALVEGLQPPPGANDTNTTLWREGVDAVAGGAGAPGGTGEGARSTVAIYALTPSGVHLMVAAGGAADVSFDRGLLVLPADVAAGRTWTATSRTRLDGREVEVSDTARAEPAADVDLRTRGCLDVTHRYALGSVAGESTATWCPGRGMVAGTPLLGRPRRAWTGAWPAGAVAAPALPRLSDPPTVALRPLSSGFGRAWADQEGALLPVATTGVAFGGDRFVVADVATGSLVAYAPGGAGAGQAGTRVPEDTHDIQPPGPLRTAWWVQPGGPVTALDPAGDLVVATTGWKRVVAYDRAGRRVWRNDLTDLAPGGVARLGDDAVVVATLSGEVRAIALADGRQRWRATLNSGTASRPVVAGDRVFVATTEDSLVALDAATGDVVFDQDEVSGEVAVAPDGSPVVHHVGGQMVRLDPASGGVDAIDLVGVGQLANRLVAAHGYVAALGPQGLTMVDPGAIAEVGRLAGVLDLAPTPAGWVAVTHTEALVLAPNGDVRSRTPLGVEVDSVRLTPAAGAYAALVTRTGSRKGGEVLWIR